MELRSRFPLNRVSSNFGSRKAALNEIRTTSQVWRLFSATSSQRNRSGTERLEPIHLKRCGQRLDSGTARR